VCSIVTKCNIAVGLDKPVKISSVREAQRKSLSDRFSEVWGALRSHFLRPRKRLGPIEDLDALVDFIDGRSSLVSQTSLYGYLKTRAGTRFPALFEDEQFLKSINIAKWQIWCACVSDLAVYTGRLIFETHPENEKVRELMRVAVTRIAERTGVPDDAGQEFPSAVKEAIERIDDAQFSDLDDLEAIFKKSGDALVQWSPIVDELKVLDEDIVRNSIRFRWQEPRRDLRAVLKIDSIMSNRMSQGKTTVD
jgi:hypothetical protein